MPPMCDFPGCGRPLISRGLCEGHYTQARHERPLAPLKTRRPKTADPAEWFWNYVDKTNNCWNWTAGTNGRGYGNYRIGGRKVGVHRFAYELTYGPIPEGMQIDHICHNTLCVNPDHLRIVTAKQNAENLAPNGSKRNKSGFRGVSRGKKNRKWRVCVGHLGKVYHGGYFNSAEEANVAAVALRAKLFTHSSDHPQSPTHHNPTRSHK